MAIYKVQGPDGAMHELDGPDGATDEQIIEAAEEAFGQQAPATDSQSFEANREAIEPGIMEETSPTGQKLIENSIHAVEGVGTPMMAAGLVKGAAGLVGNGAKKIGGVGEYLSGKFGKWADEAMVKSADPTTANLQQIGEKLYGPDAVRNMGRVMREKGIGGPFKSAEDMNQAVVPLREAAGQDIGAFRELGDLRGSSPTPEALKQTLAARYGSKFDTGLHAGSKGEYTNAIEELTKQNPQNFSELSGVATDMNAFAKTRNSLMQPNTATTDVANTIAHESDDALKNVLGDDLAASYDAAKQEHGIYKNIESITDRSQYRDMAANAQIPLSRTGTLSAVANMVAPPGIRSSVYGKLEKMLQNNPAAFGRNRETLMRAAKAGQSSLASTIYMLQQQDPEFKQQFADLQNQ